METTNEKLTKSKHILTPSQALLAAALVCIAVTCVLRRRGANSENHDEPYVKAMAKILIVPEVAKLSEDNVLKISNTSEQVGKKRKLIERVLNFFDKAHNRKK